MIKKQSTTKGFAILGAASIFNKVLSIIYVPFLTFLISDYGNGIANTGYTIYLLVFQITYMGIPVAISKIVSEQVALGQYRNSLRTLKISGIMLVSLGIVLTLSTAFCAHWLADMSGRPTAYLTLLALSPTVLLASISATFRGYFQGRHNMVPTSISQIVEQAFNTVCTLAFAWWMLKIGRHQAGILGITGEEQISLYSFQWGAAGSAMGTSAGALVSMIYLIITFVRNRKSMHDEAEKEARDYPNSSLLLTKQIVHMVLKYSVPITLGVIIVYSANFVDLIFTNNRLVYAGFSNTDATKLFGILTTQYQKLINVPLALANTLAIVLLPSISSAATLQNRNLLHRKIYNGIRSMFIVTIPSAVILAVMAEPIIQLLFSEKYTHGVDLLVIGSWVIILTAFVQIQTSIIQGIGHMHRPTIHMAIALVLKIIINYILIGIPAINIRGAVAGTMICYGLAGLLNYRYMCKLTGFRTRWFMLLTPPMISSLIMAVAMFVVWHGLDALLKTALPGNYIRNLVSTIPALAIGGAVYGAALLLLKGIFLEEVRQIPVVGNIIKRRL